MRVIVIGQDMVRGHMVGILKKECETKGWRCCGCQGSRATAIFLVVAFSTSGCSRRNAVAIIYRQNWPKNMFNIQNRISIIQTQTHRGPISEPLSRGDPRQNKNKKQLNTKMRPWTKDMDGALSPPSHRMAFVTLLSSTKQHLLSSCVACH